MTSARVYPGQIVFHCFIIHFTGRNIPPSLLSSSVSNNASIEIAWQKIQTFLTERIQCGLISSWEDSQLPASPFTHRAISLEPVVFSYRISHDSPGYSDSHYVASAGFDFMRILVLQLQCRGAQLLLFNTTGDVPCVFTRGEHILFSNSSLTETLLGYNF